MGRKLLLTLAALFFAAVALKAVPAYPGLVKYRQPDGTLISIRLHGDEFYHYATTDKGQVVALDRDGFYRPAAKPFRGLSEFERMSVRSRSAKGRLQAPGRRNLISEGKKKFLVILVDFPDLKFTTENANNSFSNLLNQTGYSLGGATGSVSDYYYENSSGKFDPEFVVAGPYTAEKNYAEYGKNDANENDTDPQGAFYEACVKAAADGLDFSVFDNDTDGYVDNVYFFYAGRGEADGGGANTIWPHQSAIYKYNFTSNGVRVWSYACSAELRGYSGALTGIGVFCHEFGHVLGLPDFYDTDYEKNGSANEVYDFSLMSVGSYNNDGNSPPYLSYMERWMLGWLEVSGFAKEGGKTLSPVQENDGMRTPSSTEGEFFVYEYRNGEGWDRYISSSNNPKGMLIYHVDMSDNPATSQYSALTLWQRNEINCYSSHPCYYLVAPMGNASSMRDYTLPGPKGITSYVTQDWSRANTGYALEGIHVEGGKMAFSLVISRSKTVSGRVTDSYGAPLAGVAVSAVAEGGGNAPSSSAKRIRSIREVAAMAPVSVKTGSDGRYSVTLEDAATNNITLTFTKARYLDHAESFVMHSTAMVRDVTLHNVTEGNASTLQKCGKPNTNLGYSSSDPPFSATCGMYYSAYELLPYVGNRLRSISFLIGGTSSVIDVFVDFGATRALTRRVNNHVPDQMCTVDISDAGLCIPAGSDVIIGYSVKDTETRYFMGVDSGPSVEGGAYIRYGYYTAGLNPSQWWTIDDFNFIISADIGEFVSPFSALGIKVIANPAGAEGYEEGSVFTPSILNPEAGISAERTEWFFDGNPISGESFALSGRGRHTLKAVLSYGDGTSEEIEQVILVK